MSKDYILKNSNIELVFNDSGCLKKFKDLKNSNELAFVSEKKSLWKIAFRDKTGNISYLYSNQLSHPEILTREKSLQIKWQIPQYSSSIKAMISLEKDSTFADCGFELKNNSGMSIWEVQYPILDGFTGIGDKQDEDLLAVPWQFGLEIPNPLKAVNEGGAKKRDWMSEYAQYNTNEEVNKIAFLYPGMWSLQFMAFYNNKRKDRSGLYFGAHDGEARIKRFGIYQHSEESLSIIMTNYPDERITADLDYIMPYPVKFGLFQGDWLDAAEYYRKWAVKQKWCSKGKVKDRKDIPGWLKENDFWFWNWSSHSKDMANAMPEMFSRIVVELKKQLDCNLAAHWYGAHCEPFFMRIPELFPISPSAKKKLQYGLDLMHKNNIKVIPYMNPRTCDHMTDTWEKYKVEEMACETEDGSLHEEVYREDLPRTTVCPSQKKWHDIIADIIGECLEHGYDGVYLDQISSCYAVPCFSDKHGHPRGGGNTWSSGYHQMMEKIQHKFKTSNTCFASESTVECYNDVFDTNLARKASQMNFDTLSANDRLIPMCNSIYHDYIITYGSSTILKTDLPEVVYLTGALNLISGNQLSFEGCTWVDLKHNKYQEYLEYYRRLCAFRKKFRKFFNLGEWQRAPEIKSEKIKLYLSEVRPDYVVPAVFSGAWKLNNNVLTYFVNHTDCEQKIDYVLNNGVVGNINVPAKNVCGFEI